MPTLAACPRCGKEFRVTSKRKTYCSVDCRRAAFVARNAEISRRTAAARGDKLRGVPTGRGTKPAEYTKLNGRHRHRVVAEQKIGRPLRPGEIVHHDNHDKKDDSPENLIVVPRRSDHIREHLQGLQQAAQDARRRTRQRR